MKASTAKNKATRRHSEVVRARGACENCGDIEPANLQCAHIISRRYAATRCDPANAFCLCARCHMRFTEWPLEFHAFVIEQIGANGYDDLRVKAEAGVKTSVAFWIEQYNALGADHE